MADSDDFDRDDSFDEEVVTPRPRNNLLTVALLLLNIVAALAFAYLLVMDLQIRQDWTYAAFMQDLQREGLPQDADEAGPTASREAQPRQRLTSEQITAIFSKRGGKGSGPFAPVEEVVKSHMRGSMLTPEMLKEHFGEATTVRTIEDEIRVLKDSLVKKIEETAKATAAKATDANAKRKLVQEILFSLASHAYQVDKLRDKIQNASAEELDEMLNDAAQRRMYVDLLAPLELFRAGDAPTLLAQQVANLEDDAFKPKQLRERLERHLAALEGKHDPIVHVGKDWDSIEKRRAIAFFLVDLAFLKKPGAEEIDAQKLDTAKLEEQLVFPRGLTRAQAVCGVGDFSRALQNLTIAWNIFEVQTVAAIERDRDGIEVKSGKAGEGFVTIPGFVAKHEDEIRRILELKRHILTAEVRLVKLQDQLIAAKTLYKDREGYMNEVLEKVVAARKITAKRVAELRALQAELFEAERQLAEAAERNERLEAEIRAREGLKGAKTP